jgi:hypothetical protein
MSQLRAPTRRGLFGLVAIVLALSMTMFGAVVSTASATHRNPHRLHDTAKNVKVMSYIHGRTGSGKIVRGVFIPRQFKTVGNRIYAQGRVKGKIVRPGKDRHFVKRGVMIPLQTANGQAVTPSGARACPVLNLVLGPVDLNVLGLVVHLDRVVLNIIAQSGAGQLLGNLLCAVAGLLDGGPLAGLLGQLQGLLNRILGIVGPLGA